MQSGWRIGSLFGIPLYVDLSWFLVLTIFGLRYGLQWQAQYPQWRESISYGVGVATVLLLFGSVLMHELGHSLVARSQGIKVNSITLFLFGGIASIDQESKTPGKAFQVAIAGPCVSLVLFVGFALLTVIVPDSFGPINALVQELARINLVLALFNLIPGLPLDGGQILKALVWKRTGSRLKGVYWAAKSGKFLGWTAIVMGLGVVLFQGASLGLWITFLGWFVLQNASRDDRLNVLQENLLQLYATDAMSRDFRVVDANMSLQRFADTYLLESVRPTVYFAASEGRYRGMVMPDELNYVERSLWETQNLFRIIHPLSEIPTVEEATRLVNVIQQLESQQLRQITVLSPAGAVSGMIDRGDIVQAIAEKMGTPVSDTLIKQIKEEGNYPPGLQLGALAELAAESTTNYRDS